MQNRLPRECSLFQQEDFMKLLEMSWFKNPIKKR